MNIDIRPSRYDATKVEIRFQYNDNHAQIVMLTPEELFELASAIDDYLETEEFMAIYIGFIQRKRMRDNNAPTTSHTH